MKRIAFALFSLWFACAPAGAVFARTSNDPKVKQWAYEDTGVYRAWDMATGSKDVVVAVIDNGFDSGHPDLKENVWTNTKEIANNKIDDDKNGYVDDTQGWNFVPEDTNKNGKIDKSEEKGNNTPRPDVSDLSKAEKDAQVFSHGTVVAGIIGAVGNNSRDGVGINWKVRLMNIKVLGNDGFGFLDKMPDAIRYAVDNGAHVINISIVGASHFNELDEALEYAYDKGVFVVVASGNDSMDLNNVRMYPVCSDAGGKVNFVIGTSAVDEDHHSAFFSNVGSDCIDIAAPGVGINSTLRYSPNDGLTKSYGTGWDGTSFASPFIAGAAALIKSVRPDWKAPEIVNAIMKTTQHTPGQDEDVYADLFGKGLIQIDKAIAYALKDKPATPGTSSQRNIVLSYQPLTGDVEERNTITGTSSLYKRIGLIGIDKLVSYLDEAGVAHNAVAKAGTNGVRQITISDRKFKQEKVVTLKEKTGIDFMIGNVDATNPGLEIVVAPRDASTLYYRVYDMNGNVLFDVLNDKQHSGVQLALVKDASGQSNIALLYTVDGKTQVAQRNKITIVKQFEVPAYANGGTIAAGDIDADGVDEVVIGSGKGQETALAYYELDGSLKSKFYGYAPGFTGGIRAQILDYDADGADDVLISALDGSQPVRVWNKSVKRLDNWYPFGETFRGTFLTISSF